MKVLATDENDVKQVIIGQSHETEEFEIANTPAMMNILSSGLYENPLKAVVREIMFNAWDAQKDNGKEDQPIEVTVNIDNGIIIRDHGTGIHQSKIHKIYCVYGASTKVNVKDATGGFGFGTKAPFSYADAFTVISYHEGVKSVNLINKIGENTGGKPGRTLMAQVPTDESGIAVTVGLKNIYDVEQIVKYVKSIMYLSGMKVKFTYNLSEENDPADTIVEILEDDGIMPHEMIIRGNRHDLPNDGSRYADDSGVYAVYGGVRYRIPDHEKYENAYKQLKIFTRNSGAVYFGFAPDTLTPQPSRDGLNMSELTIDSIREIISTTSEEIIDLVDEAISLGLEAFLNSQSKLNIQPHFVLDQVYAWYVEQNNMNLKDFGIKLIEYANANLKEDRSENYTWFNLLNIVSSEIGYLDSFSSFTAAKRQAQVYVQFLRYFPEAKKLLFDFKEIMASSHNKKYFDRRSSLEEYVCRQMFGDLFKFEEKMKTLVASPRHEPKMRMKGNMGNASVWHKVSRDRTEINKQENKDRYRHSKFIDKPAAPYPDRAWTVASGRTKEICKLVMLKHVIIVKTISRLDVDNYINPPKFSNKEGITAATYTSSRRGYTSYSPINRMIPAYVIPTVKGTYDKAKNLLIDMGYNVIEIEEQVYEKSEKVSYVQTEILNYKLDPSYTGWYQGGDENLVEFPEFYLKVNSSRINQSSYCPDAQMISEFIIDNPNSVMCTTQREAKAMIAQGAVNIVDWFNDWAKKLIKNKSLLRRLVRYDNGVSEDYNSYFKLSDAFLKEVGVTLKDISKTEFQRQYVYFSEIMESDYPEFFKSKLALNAVVEKIKEKDTRLAKNEKFFKQMSIIDDRKLYLKLMKMDTITHPTGREDLCKKVIKFVKTI